MFIVKNEFLAAMKVALVAVGMMMATSCNSTQSANEETNENQQAMQIEQVQPQVHRAAFIPIEGTPDFVGAAEKSLNAVVHIKTKIEKQTNTYNDFFGALLQQFYGMPGQTQKHTSKNLKSEYNCSLLQCPQNESFQYLYNLSEVS